MLRRRPCGTMPVLPSWPTPVVVSPELDHGMGVEPPLIHFHTTLGRTARRSSDDAAVLHRHGLPNPRSGAPSAKRGVSKALVMTTREGQQARAPTPDLGRWRHVAKPLTPTSRSRRPYWPPTTGQVKVGSPPRPVSRRIAASVRPVGSTVVEAAKGDGIGTDEVGGGLGASGIRDGQGDAAPRTRRVAARAFHRLNRWAVRSRYRESSANYGSALVSEPMALSLKKPGSTITTLSAEASNFHAQHVRECLQSQTWSVASHEFHAVHGRRAQQHHKQLRPAPRSRVGQQARERGRRGATGPRRRVLAAPEYGMARPRRRRAPE